MRSIRQVIDARPGGWFTSDIRSTENSPDEFLALNYHCLDDDFKYWCFTLGLQSFDDRKTAEAIFSSWVLCLVEWGILTPIPNVPEFVNANGRQLRNQRAFRGWRKVWGIVADNGTNIQGALVHMFQEIYDESPPCLGHTVQLVVNDSIDSQRAVIDILAIGRNLVSFINKSKPAKSMLFQLQRDQGIVKPLTVVQNVEPRWDSELAMLERLVKLRVFIRDLAEHPDFVNKITSYTPYQWELVSGVMSMLCPVRVLTKYTQEAPPRPGFALFEVARCKAELEENEGRGQGTMKREIVQSFSDRLAQYIEKKPYIFASLLDINLKGCVFTREQRAEKWELLVSAVTDHIGRIRGAAPLPQVAENVVPIAPREPGNRDMNFLANLLEQNEADDIPDVNPLQDARLEAEREVSVYRSYPQDATLSTNAREWWNTKHHMPHLRFFARKYLPFPVGEGDCERTFSKTGLIYCPRRKCLLPFNCKMMVVTNAALRAFNFQLDGDVKLTIPDFITHERDLINANMNEENDDSTDEEMCL